MEIDNKYKVAGLVGAVVVFAIGYIAGGRGADAPDVAAAIGPKIDATAEALGGVDARIGGLEAQLGELAARFDTVDSALAESGAATASAVAEVRADVTALGERVGSEIEAALAEAAKAAPAAVAAVPMETPAAEPAPVEPPAAPVVEAAAPAPAPADASGVGVGGTALLADGTIRVFVARLDETAGQARIAVNGLETATLATGRSLGVFGGDTYCRVTLAGFDGRTAGFSSACGDDLPAPDGVRPGETGLLDDGALRVFVSAVDGNEAHATLAINGLDRVQVARGEEVSVRTEIGTCTVGVAEIDRGRVRLDGGC